ncbi:hypothetical protein F5X99DRAFT_414956 [Biscogniauxia marginata]|nr:hypothetical protein F5X99DRAFT_414956 [Biscogniauxia marginata]
MEDETILQFLDRPNAPITTNCPPSAWNTIVQNPPTIEQRTYWDEFKEYIEHYKQYVEIPFPDAPEPIDYLKKRTSELTVFNEDSLKHISARWLLANLNDALAQLAKDRGFNYTVQLHAGRSLTGKGGMTVIPDLLLHVVYSDGRINYDNPLLAGDFKLGSKWTAKPKGIPWSLIISDKEAVIFRGTQIEVHPDLAASRTRRHQAQPRPPQGFSSDPPEPESPQVTSSISYNTEDAARDVDFDKIEYFTGYGQNTLDSKYEDLDQWMVMPDGKYMNIVTKMVASTVPEGSSVRQYDKVYERSGRTYNYEEDEQRGAASDREIPDSQGTGDTMGEGGNSQGSDVVMDEARSSQ